MNRMNWQINIAAVLCAIALLASAAAAVETKDAREREARAIETLKSDAPFAEKNLACRELHIFGTQTSIPALAALLPDQQLSHPARYALQPMPYPEAGAALRDALPRAEGLAKIGIIGSLGYREDKAAVPALAALLKDSSADIAGAACAALGQIGTEAAIEGLEPFFQKHPKSCEAVVAETGLRIGERCGREGRLDSARKIYRDLLQAKWPEHIRQGAFVGQLTALPDEAADSVIAAIGGGDALLRNIAVANVAMVKSEAAVKRFAAELPKLAPKVQAPLIDALAAGGNVAVRPAIEAAVASPAGDVRLAALNGLGKVGGASSVKLLAGALAKSNAAEKQAASDSLLQLKGADIDPAIVKCLSGAAPAARAELIDALRERRATSATPALLEQAAGADGDVRKEAFKALAELAEPAQLPQLLALLTALDGDAGRKDAERAAAAVSRKIPDEAAQADPALAALRQSKATPAKGSLLRVLQGVGNAKALAAVENSLKDDDADVRDAAVRALADWPNALAAKPLLAAFSTAKSEIHRVIALRGCVSMLQIGGQTPQETLNAYSALMKDAKRADEKKLVLAGLTNVADPAALKVVAPFLEDDAVKAEAELAQLGIARAIMGTARDDARAAATQLRAESKNDAVRQEAGAILNQIEQFEDFIVSWQVAGPYKKGGRGGAQLFNVKFPPEEGAADIEWKALPLAKSGKPWMFDLGAAVGGDQCVAYARTWVYSEKAQPALLEMGADDGIKALLNGKLVHGNNSAGAAVPGEEKAEVSLKEGWNLLLLKVIQHTAGWEFCARLRAADGGALAGVRVDANHGGLPTVAAAAKPGTKLVAVPLGDWTPLFNGKDLTGWKATGDAIFTVEDGNLIGTQTTGKGGDLWTEGEYGDFELRATYKVIWPANSGFWFRHDGKKGYQFDVLKYRNPVAFSGTLYCPGKMFITSNLNEGLENRDGWNEARISAAGDELTLWLNGTKTGECRDDTLSKGRIGIQVHPGNEMKGMKIIIKSLEIRELAVSGGQ